MAYIGAGLLSCATVCVTWMTPPGYEESDSSVDANGDEAAMDSSFTTSETATSESVSAALAVGLHLPRGLRRDLGSW